MADFKFKFVQPSSTEWAWVYCPHQNFASRSLNLLIVGDYIKNEMVNILISKSIKWQTRGSRLISYGSRSIDSPSSRADSEALHP